MKYSIVKLRTNEFVMGEIANETEKGIDMKDALTINYKFDEQGYPVLYFSKYSLFTRSYDIFLSRQDVMNIFRDPITSIVEYYELNIKRVKEINRDEIPMSNPNDDDDDYDLLSMFAKGTNSVN